MGYTDFVHCLIYWKNELRPHFCDNNFFHCQNLIITANKNLVISRWRLNHLASFRTTLCGHNLTSLMSVSWGSLHRLLGQSPPLQYLSSHFCPFLLSWFALQVIYFVHFLHPLGLGSSIQDFQSHSPCRNRFRGLGESPLAWAEALPSEVTFQSHTFCLGARRRWLLPDFSSILYSTFLFFLKLFNYLINLFPP